VPEQPSVTIVAANLDIVGGHCVQAQALIDCLREDGFDARLLPINPRFPYGLGWLRRLPGIRTLVNQLFYLPSLTRLAQTDVVHIFSASYSSFLLAPLPAIVAGKMFGRRVVLHYHSGEADDHLSSWGLFVHPWLRLADKLVVPSEYLKGVFACHGYQVRVVPNIVDLTAFRYRPRRPIAPNFLSTRNLEPYYRVDIIIEAFARFLKSHATATLTITGYGSLERRLRLLAKRVAGDRVEFLGRLEPSSMPHVYDEADVFLNASVVDNQPVSILEAFASGLPVITTATGDIRSLVRRGKTGVIVPPSDPAAMAAAMSATLEKPERALEMAERAHDEVNRFTWRNVRSLWTEIYSSVHSERTVPRAI
jgi:L-malate glycosyltransferase